ncbi:MAG: aspartate/glutamate racemase family protein [Actinomycetota bacterium]
MHIGLIGGIGPAATDFYHRGLIDRSTADGFDLDLTIAYASSATLLDNLARNAVDAQVRIFLGLIERLAAAGAEQVAITAIGGHFCVPALAPVSPLPLVDLIRVTDQALAADGVSRVGILGTRTAMATGLYGRVSSAEVIAPPGPTLDDVHDAYVEMASAGAPTDGHRDVFVRAGQTLIDDHGAERILLAGTDLVLVFGGNDDPFEVVDCAALHVAALADLAAS